MSCNLRHQQYWKPDLFFSKMEISFAQRRKGSCWTVRLSYEIGEREKNLSIETEIPTCSSVHEYISDPTSKILFIVD